MVVELSILPDKNYLQHVLETIKKLEIKVNHVLLVEVHPDNLEEEHLLYQMRKH